MITGVTPEIQEKVQQIVLAKLEEFWHNSPDELYVPLELPDGMMSLAEQACDWIAGECEAEGTRLACE